ncbi:MAG: UDP-N-acetylmuramoyl-tripeptide--D-alanyl-D-alanine ligase [Flavobacteriaceae bacterium]|jgi:UDP-N-acetylmuramoyl-tripeptide--D-alanyl-D-alanine ligase|nr:UDP-N-acetylmuramoyl-tripeptide--D-alanyl-D-alanine ligase [Flavobacteriaceae bacterium]MBT6705795.1 UDP-N-acetylmuramoyl-tripeptide--D-alanyl-D-alanine ligase [Flavobacteriaceae bacterium]|tara:strand:- start:68 stop:1342 length:1275 start_codon:yes stop_codon:yes gene_type:complete
MIIEEIHKHFIKSSGICTDTRSINNNCLFFALKGANFNGNTFVNNAIEKGAYKVIIDEKEFQNDHSILVHDVLETLQELATFHRNYLNIPIIALTGSNGKTTTKELINIVLSKKYNTVATKGNLNNHIGVPLTLLAMNSNTEIGIVEMGANDHKEIELLCKIAKPDYGYITNFGKAHLEGFGSLEGVIEAKTEMYRYLKSKKNTVFVNFNDTKQRKHSEGINRYTFGDEDQNCIIKLVDASNEVLLNYQNTTIQSHLIGQYNYTNIAASIAIGEFFNVTAQNIKAAIENFIPANNRSQLIEKGTNRIILDAYNANPSSMMAALENFIQSQGDQKTVFIGDMFELGTDAEKEHQNIVSYLENNYKGTCYLVGENFNKTTVNFSTIYKFKTFEKLKTSLVKTMITNQYVLIKGSRGMALERVLKYL